MKPNVASALLLTKRLHIPACMYVHVCQVFLNRYFLIINVVFPTVVLLNMSASTSKVKKSENDRKESMAFIKDICERRNSEAIVSQDYDFDLSRRRFLTECRIIKPGRPIIYYMQRDFRINDNWGIIYAQMLALQKKVSLHICFFAKQTPSLYPTMRQFEFLVEGNWNKTTKKPSSKWRQLF